MIIPSTLKCFKKVQCFPSMEDSHPLSAHPLWPSSREVLYKNLKHSLIFPDKASHFSLIDFKNISHSDLLLDTN